jgi:hypothetical protein
MSNARADAVDDAPGEDARTRGALGVLRVDVEDLREQNLREAVPAHDASRALHSIVRQFQCVAALDQLRGDQLVDRARGVTVQLQFGGRGDRAGFLARVPQALEHFVSGRMLHVLFSWQ